MKCRFSFAMLAIVLTLFVAPSQGSEPDRPRDEKKASERNKKGEDLLDQLDSVRKALSKRVTINLHDADFRQVLGMLNRFSEAPIILSPEVRRKLGPVTIRLENGEIARALEMIARKENLQIVITGGNVVLRPKAPKFDAKRIDHLIKNLDSAQWAVRDAARKELGQAGLSAKAALEKAAKTGSAEVRQSVKWLLGDIRERQGYLIRIKELRSTNATLRANYREYLTKHLEASARAQLFQSKSDEQVQELGRRHTQINTMHLIILKQQQAIMVAKRNGENAITKMHKLEKELEAAKKELKKLSGDRNPAENPSRTEE